MIQYDPGLPLVSIHVPKCAGVSFKSILKAWFGEKLFFHYHDEINNTPPRKHKIKTGFIRKKYIPGVCIHGHFNRTRGIGVRDYYPEVSQFISILRDPFDIHLSNFFFVKKIDRGMFRDGQTHYLVEQEYDLQKYLSENKKSLLHMFFPSDISLENYQKIIEERFVYIGIAEDLQTSVDTLAEKLGFPTMEVPVKNISPRNEQVPDGAREEFIGNNPLEMAVYEYALKRYRG